ncbi:MAG: hypothetical protein ABW277_07575 [Longimicrobiaceae bacterium]
MRWILLLASSLCLASGELRSQSFAHWLEPGTRVRVTAPALEPARVAGNVALLHPDTLVLERRGRRLPIANARIDLIEVSRGLDRRRGAWRGTILGALVGAGLGVTFGALGAQDLPTGIGTSAALGFLGGGLVGGGLGAGVGAVFAPERWQGYRIEHPTAAALRRP